MPAQPQTPAGAERLARVKAPWLTGTMALAIILVAFVVALINAGLDTPNQFHLGAD